MQCCTFLFWNNLSRARAETFASAAPTAGKIAGSSHPARALRALLLSDHGWDLQPVLNSVLALIWDALLRVPSVRCGQDTHKEALLARRLQGCCVKNTDCSIQSFMLCMKQAISLLTELEDATK